MTDRRKTGTGTGTRKNRRRGRRPRKRKLTRFIAFALLLSAAVIVGILADRERKAGRTATAESLEEPGFSVIFLDVGEADAALVIADGHAMLVDGGNRDDSGLVYDALKKEGVERLDYVVCSHAHEDHAGGLISVFGIIEERIPAEAPETAGTPEDAVTTESGGTAEGGEAPEAAGADRSAAGWRRTRRVPVPADCILAPQEDSGNYFYHELISSARASGVPVIIPGAGDVFSLGGAEMTVLGPVRSAEDILSDEFSDVNNTSLVIKVRYGEVSVLFTGDAEWPEEAEILDRAGEAGKDPESGTGELSALNAREKSAEEALGATILKVGHHGSATSSSYRFLMAVCPEYAVISCGAGNEHGHPHEETLEKLDAGGASILRTDLQGEIRFSSDGKALAITTGHP